MRTVFIGGHSRSGTTLLGAMIGSHAECICTPESQFKIQVFRHFKKKGERSIEIPAALELIDNDWRFKIWGLDAGSAPCAGIASYQDLVLCLVSAYAGKCGKYEPVYWVDHTPSNIKNAETLRELFPGSKFIHIVRDGRAIAASIIPLDWGPNTISEAARSWRRRVSNYLGIESLLGKDIMRIKYEDLVQDPEKTLRRICLFLDMSYQPCMIQGGGFKVPGYTAGQHSLLGQKPDAKRAGAWEKELTARQVEIFESIAGKLLLYLGYPLKHSKAREMSLVEKLALNVEEGFKRNITNKIRHRRRIKKGISLATGN